MSKSCSNNKKKHQDNESDCVKSNSQNNEASTVCIGVSNVKQWNELKNTFKYNCDIKFTSFLLNLARKHNARRNNDDKRKYISCQLSVDNRGAPRRKTKQIEHPAIHKHKRTHSKTSHRKRSHGSSQQHKSNKHCDKKEEKPNEINKITDKAKQILDFPLPMVVVENLNLKIENRKKHKPEPEKKRKVKHHDIRKAPQLDLIKSEPEEIKTERVAIKIKLCNTCNTRHLQDTCPLKHPNITIEDSVLLNDDISFAESSLPFTLYLEECDSAHGLSVFAKQDIKIYTQFGPLIGEIIKEVDIAEDSNMRYIWEVYQDKKNIYISSENINTSNWFRYLRPAPNRDLKNLLAICESQQVFMISTRDISTGEELLYWQDDSTGPNKKKMEKTNCGGCNLTFTHPLYYRVHCSIFHDIRYSLTIRKYHCKVCGAAILGKDNIMKHAVELHNGQGAYQCQFCKKFFLRLNYLEMHRTYGCAANPHRSRPLCDFCGRKFCQPQKLKVHIKRMHSDMSEVLREFQCKNCLKLLGSRAALQRHVKEVHQKQMDGSCTCVRCGKLFQNKSNLKIHMLTHSGVKPFKCREQNCNAAFTTKQCLQFHYKKVHGFAEEIMPKIERSVEYTFAAYAGVKHPENEGNTKNSRRKIQEQAQINANLLCLDDSTDVDDISLDDKNLDDPPALDSPTPIVSEHSSPSNETPPMLEVYRTNSTKIQSKGSKKWLGEDSLNLSLQQPPKEVYQFEKEIQKPAEPTPNIMLDVDESQSFDRNKISMNLNVYNRHESSNASLLVEAALDSVSDIQITTSEHNVDVNVSQNCTDSLVNNLYSLSHQDNLPDVSYNHSEDLNESRDINLISPSVNDHISVTDHDLNDDLPNRGISLDYSNLHHSEFSPSSSPNRSQQLIHDYNIHASNSPARTPRSRLDYTLGHDSEIVSPGNSPPRYDFHHTPAENLSSDESNGIVAQNLSLNSKDKLRLDLVGYKSHYGDLDDLRKYDLRPKYDLEDERNKNYDIRSKFDETAETDLRNKTFEVETDFRNKYDQIDTKYEGDTRNKQIEIDDLETERSKTYENNLSTNSVIDNLELRNKYDNIVDSDFRTDRNFEPLVLNPTELQGLDMSARSYHNFHASGTGINRYHHIYSELDRPTVDLRLGYSPPPPPYNHADVLRVVSLDLTPPGRHSVDLSLRSHALHSHQLQNSRLLTDHPLPTNRLISTEHNLSHRLLTNELTTNRLLSDHTTNRLLSNDQLSSNRLLTDETRLLDTRISNTNHDLVTRNSLSPGGYTGYPVSPSPYLAARTHGNSPGHTASGYHHYSTYY